MDCLSFQSSYARSMENNRLRVRQMTDLLRRIFRLLTLVFNQNDRQTMIENDFPH